MVNYILDNIRSLFTDFGGTLAFFLLALPGRLLAISAHEFAHAYVADKCGDPTARMLGRLTLNPLKHLDVIGTLMMLVLGIGWAKPVPVNPRNFRNYRRDDLKVSLAGVTMNLILFIVGFVLLSAALAFILGGLPRYGSLQMAAEENFITQYLGQTVVVTGEYYMPVKDLLLNAPYVGEYLIQPLLGRVAGYAYQMVSYFTLVNISLTVFNLLPVPPLDGYHVLNDLVLHRSLFASPKVVRFASMALYLLMFTGALSKGLGYVTTAAVEGMGTLVYGAFVLLGLA